MTQASHEESVAHAQNERRQRPDLRTVFEDIVHRLEPFIGPRQGMAGNAMEYWAARVIHEAHPELTHHDAKVLVNAAVRYFGDKERTQQR